MNALRLIGLTGRPGCGKDSCAAALRAHGFVPVAFADALRVEVSQAWGVDARVISHRCTKEVALPALAIGHCNDPAFLHWAAYHGHSLYDPRSPRWLMQRWGTEFRRAQDPAYWVRAVEHWILEQACAGLDRVVVTDVRMPNEADMVRQLGGKLVRVHRPDLPAMAADTAGHSSEGHDALVADAVIHNDASLDALQDEVQRVVCGLFGARTVATEVPQ